MSARQIDQGRSEKRDHESVNEVRWSQFVPGVQRVQFNVSPHALDKSSLQLLPVTVRNGLVTLIVIGKG